MDRKTAKEYAIFLASRTNAQLGAVLDGSPTSQLRSAVLIAMSGYSWACLDSHLRSIEAALRVRS
jgi:hypothetical protein